MGTGRHGGWIAWLAAVGVCLGAGSAATGEAARTDRTQRPQSYVAAASQPVDVSLDEGGVLRGQLMSADGEPLAGVEVLFRAPSGMVVVPTDEQGKFSFSGVRGEVVQLSTARATQLYRLWMPGTAPPHAQESVLLVSQSDTWRAQWGPPPVLNGFVRRTKVLMANPWFVGGVVATAVAVPVIVHNANQDDGPSS